MKKVNLLENFRSVINELSPGTVSKISKIAKLMGYTTTAQLHSALNGESMLSTKAIISLIENADVNPNFLFLGQGYMFIGEVDEAESLRRENQTLKQKYDESDKMIKELRADISELQKRNDDLIELSSAAIKYHKGKTLDDSKSE